MSLGGDGGGNSVLFNGASGFSSERGVARGGRPDGIAAIGALAPGVNNSIRRCCTFVSAGGEVWATADCPTSQIMDADNSFFISIARLPFSVRNALAERTVTIPVGIQTYFGASNTNF